MSRRTRERRLGPGATRAPSHAAADVADYLDAADEDRVGDHVITPELVRGVPRSASTGGVVISSASPAAVGLLSDTIDVLWGEMRTLRDRQRDHGQLGDEDRGYLPKLTDAVTKALREERRQMEVDELSRMSEAELVELLPEAERDAFRALLAEQTEDGPDDEGQEEG